MHYKQVSEKRRSLVSITLIKPPLILLPVAPLPESNDY